MIFEMVGSWQDVQVVRQFAPQQACQFVISKEFSPFPIQDSIPKITGFAPLSIGLCLQVKDGLFRGGGFELLGVQMLMLLAVIGWSALTMKHGSMLEQVGRKILAIE